MSVSRLLTAAIALLFILSSCMRSPPPEASGTELAAQAVAAVPGVSLLPPIGKNDKSKGSFDPNVDLEIKIFQFTASNSQDLQSNPVPPTFSTEDGTIRVQGNHYHANWQTRSSGQPDDTKLRVEIRWAKSLDSEAGPACNSGPNLDNGCLAYFDVMLVRNMGRGNRDKAEAAGAIPINNGRAVPIKVFVREGALESDSALPLPDPGATIHLQITPGALLLTAKGESAGLTVRGYDDDGREVSLSGKQIEWINSDPSHVDLVAGTTSSSADATAVSNLGSAVLAARLAQDPDIVSAPITVLIADLHADTVTIPDESIVFPPPHIPPTATPDNHVIPGIAEVGGVLMVGSFEADGEVAPLFNFAEDELELYYPVVLQGAAPPVGSPILSSGGAPVLGTVVSKEERSGFALLQVKLVGLGDIFANLNFELDFESLQDQAILGPMDSSSTVTPLAAGNKESCKFGDADEALQLFGSDSIEATLENKLIGSIVITDLLGQFVVGIESEFKIEPTMTWA